MGYFIHCVDFHGLTQSSQCAGGTSLVAIIIITTMITKSLKLNLDVLLIFVWVFSLMRLNEDLPQMDLDQHLDQMLFEQK